MRQEMERLLKDVNVKIRCAKEREEVRKESG